MNSPPFNWSSLITQVADPIFGIPPDVTFQIVEDDQIREVKAHKMVLGMVSPMFKKMFFTTDVGDKTAKDIDIKETTCAAFQIMIDAIYNTESIEDSLDGKGIHELFDVINLIERYQITEFEKIIEEHISNYPLTDDTVLEVAAEAMEYNTLFQTQAQNLLLTCAKFLRPKLNDTNAIFRYVSENKNHKDAVSMLLAKIYENFEIPCANCNYKKENCQNGKEVNENDFREGIDVTINRASNVGWSKFDSGTCKVTEMTATHVTLYTVKPGVTQNGLIGAHFAAGQYYAKVQNGIPSFLFSCN